MNTEKIAEIAHEINRAYCEALGDFSQVGWNAAPEWQRKSAIEGVLYHMLTPTSTPQDSHNSWMKQKSAEGWVYGPVKDPEKKEHPCMVPYGELPREQRAKDYLFLAVVRCLEHVQ